MAIALIQTVVCGLACFGLWKLLLRTRSFGFAASSIVIAGFLGRAVVGQILFWISYLQLPIASNLQIGGGFWFFALDGKSYFTIASEAVNAGPLAIIFLEDSIPSVFYIQMLASFMLLLGNIASVGLFLNLLAYIGLSLIILLWARRSGRIGTAPLTALAGVAFTPGLILWSLQPLKDTLFVFLTVLFVGASYSWKELLKTPTTLRSWPFLQIAGAGLAISLALYGLAGMRWYFAVIVLIASIAFLLLSAALSSQRWLVLGLNMILFFVLSRMVVFGAGPYLPPQLQSALALGTAVESMPAVSQGLVAEVKRARQGFDRHRGNTTILAGPGLRTIQEVAEQSLPGKKVVEQPPAAKRAAKPDRPAVAAIEQPEAQTRSVSLAPAQQTSSTPAVPSPAALSDRREARSMEPTAGLGTVSLPDTIISRIVTGLAAVILPRTLAQKLGIIRVGGGRGFWALVELDTIIFDAVLLMALVFLIKWIRNGSLADPMVWLVVLMTLLLAAPLVYTVSNFGTLFRLRAMVLVSLLLVPPAVTASIRAVTRSRVKEGKPVAASGSEAVEPAQASG